MRAFPSRGLEDRVSDNHLSDGTIAEYLDHALAPGERQQVESHLDACAECRRVVIEVMRAADSYEAAAAQDAPPGRGPVTHTTSAPRAVARRRWAVLVGSGLLAASLGSVLLLRPAVSAPEAPVVRGVAPFAGGDRQPRIHAVQPPSGAVVPGRAVTFAWRATTADAYRIVLLTESGEPVWTHETADTSAVLATEVTLRPGASYFWRVDAIADGIVATSGTQRLQVAP
jgi:predicted anti-sigma-YlaC factor YlaD